MNPDGVGKEAFPLMLIANEEVRQEPQEVDLDKKTVVIEQNNVTTSRSFTIGDEQRTMPIVGTGELNEIVVVADSSDYSVEVRSDPRKLIIDKTWDQMEKLSTELSDMSAFKEDNDYIVNLGPYHYDSEIVAFVKPHSEVTFSTIRTTAEVRKEV